MKKTSFLVSVTEISNLFGPILRSSGACVLLYDIKHQVINMANFALALVNIMYALVCLTKESAKGIGLRAWSRGQMIVVRILLIAYCKDGSDQNSNVGI
jgi:hypothetical protein